MDEASRTLSDLSACLLDLHERSHDLDHREMQRYTIERIRALVPCDAGLLALGTIREGVPVGHDAFLEGRPLAFMESWERVKHEDRAVFLSTSNPGRTIQIDVDGPLFDGCEAVRAHCHAHDIAHILVTAHIAPTSRLFWVMALYRGHAACPFSEHERAVTEALVPHVFSATRQARLGQLRRSARISPAHGQYAAIANGTFVLEAEPGFTELVASEWKDWVGPTLPPPLRSRDPSVSRRVHGSLVATHHPAEDVFLVHVRRTVVADSLTDREREIADAFALGETHREIGARLDISPNTVRRHLANIYEKLGISSKVELDRMISGLS